MSQHVEKPGKGVLFYEEPQKRKHEKSPDYKGFIVLEMDYKAGDKVMLSAWEKPTSRGYSLFSLSEDNWAKKQKEQPREVATGYQKNKPDFAYRSKNDDVPF